MGEGRSAAIVGRQRHVVPPFAAQAGAGDFTFTQRHCRGTAYRRQASVLNSSAALSIAARLSGASTVPSQMTLAATL